MREADEMVLVPAGEFPMGIPDNVTYVERGHEDKGDVFDRSHPQQTVYVDAFYIDRHPVTNAQYRDFVLDTNHRPPLANGPGYENELWWDLLTGKCLDGLEDYPAVFVSWYDALAYCEWADKRLPTEAEWEKAARGTDGRRYPWGNEDFPECYHPTPLCKKQRPLTEELCSVYDYPNGDSPYGCRQMYGNVGEWCHDWYSETYSRKRPYRNPRGPGVRGEKVSRGFIVYPHVAWRGDSLSPWLDDGWIGFRCARNAR